MSDFDSKAFLSRVTRMPGVYRMINAANEVMYVGKAKNLKNRLSSYFRTANQTTKTLSMVSQIARIEVTETRTESEALILENDLIKSLKPRYNILFRDDKSYPYVLLTRHRYPRLKIYRGKPASAKGEFFGPFPSVGSIRYTVNFLQKTFQIRNCEDHVLDHRNRPCLQHQIHRCTAPCMDFVSQEAYAEQVAAVRLFLRGQTDVLIDQQIEAMEAASKQLHFEQAVLFRDRIEALRKIIEKQFVSGFENDMDVLACSQQLSICCIQIYMIRSGQALGHKTFFQRLPIEQNEGQLLERFILQFYSNKPMPAEVVLSHAVDDHEALQLALQALGQRKLQLKTQVRGKRRQTLQLLQQNTTTALQQHLSDKANQHQRLEALCECLGLEQTPQRMECFDISHTQGESTKASCVVFNAEGPLKSEYRRYNISGITPGDDYAAMQQVLRKRYSKRAGDSSRLPDVIFIDGGKGQLTIALEMAEELSLYDSKADLRLIGVAKGPDRKPGYETLFDENKDIIPTQPSDPALMLIQEIRDEAHRFAITGHRQARAKTRKQSTLEQIQGIGPVKRRLLLQKFGGLQGIACAGVEELMQIRGIERETAERIYASFHSPDSRPA